MLQLHQAGMKSQKKSSLVLDVVCLESDMTSRNIYVRGRDICMRWKFINSSSALQQAAAPQERLMKRMVWYFFPLT